MPIETIQFGDETYPAFQANGFAAKFAFPFADAVLTGVGVDIGCNRIEWKLPSTEFRTVIPIDPILDCEYHSTNFHEYLVELDFCHSSHVLEHVPNWVDALNYWHSRLKVGGVVFLYLPDHSQKYWRPHQNRKHIHAFTPEIVGAYFTDQPNKWKNTFVSGVDLNNSFMLISEKV